MARLGRERAVRVVDVWEIWSLRAGHGCEILEHEIGEQRNWYMGVQSSIK
jgi:hypothetical protein